MSTGKLGCKRKSEMAAVNGLAAPSCGFRPAMPLVAALPAGIRPWCGSKMITGRCRPGGPTPTKRTAANSGMLVEDRLATDRIQRSVGGHDAMGHPAAKPKTSQLVQIARVAHPMPDLGAVGDLRQGVPLGARDVLPRNLRPANDQFADLAGGQLFGHVERRDGTIDDADDFPLERRKTFGRRTRRRRGGFARPFLGPRATVPSPLRRGLG